MSEIHIETEHEAKEVSEGERELERDLGAAQNELEHHSETLEEHEEHLDNLKDDREWITSEIRRLEAMILAVPQVPRELLQDLTERLSSLENQVTHKTQELTKLPETVEAPKKIEERRSILDRIL